MNNDGFTDVIVGGISYKEYYPNDGDAEGISVMLGNGDGTLQDGVIYSSDFGYSSSYYYYGYYNTYNEIVRDVELADLNGDGNLDIIASGDGYNDGYYEVGNGDGLSVMLGNGDGSFQGPTTYSLQPDKFSYKDSETGYDVELADLDGDGDLDAVVANRTDIYFGSSDGLSVLTGNGDGTFNGAVNYSSDLGNDPSYYQNAYDVALGDIDNDGDIDIVAGGDNSKLDQPTAGIGQGIAVLLGNGDATFQAATTMSNGTAYSAYDSYYDNYNNYEKVQVVELADLNGDGNLDLISGSYGDEVNGNGAGLSIMLGDGDGTFQMADVFDIVPLANERIGDLQIQDLNGDGFLDLALVDGISNSTYVMFGDGTGDLLSAVSYGAVGIEYVEALALADLGDAIM